MNDFLIQKYLMIWAVADWDKLIDLTSEVEHINSSEEKAIVALFISAAHAQLGNQKLSKDFMKQAQEWNCDVNLIAQITIAGIYTMIARAEAFLGNIQKAIEYHEKALSSVDIDAKHTAHTRYIQDMIRFGLLPQALEQMQSFYNSIKEEQYTKLKPHLKVLDIEIDLLRNSVYALKKQYDVSKMINPIVGNVKKEETKSSNQTQSTSAKQYYGLNKLDQKLEAYLDYDNGYFVELGANDGINQSNTYYFEKERGWRGLLIEPILHNFLKCKKNRSHENAFACTACVSFEYDKEYINLVYSNLMTAAVGIEGDIADPKAHALSGQVYLQNGEEPVDIVVSAKTLTSLLDEANAPKVMDLLSLDVEGAEIEVLKGVDHQKYRFKYILVESRDEEKITEYFNNYGYKLIDKLSNHDYLFESDAV